MNPLRIMVVDDEPGMRMGAERALADYSLRLPESDTDITFHVSLAESGEAGLTLIQTERPDILLLDYKLPDMNGLELLKRISPACGDMLTIMITAYASIETAVTATKQGAYDFLPKPFTPQELRHVIRKASTHLLLARRARQLAEEKRQVRFQFIRVLGHELKAPIAAVEGYLNLLHDHTLGDDLARYDQMIHRSSLRLGQMRKLIADLLDMTRLESGEKKRSLEVLDLVEVAMQAIEAVKAEAEARNISLELKAPATVRMERADRCEMDMVFNNLLTNAVKYNRDGGRVGVTIEPQGGAMAISVTDTGIGMTPEETALLFQEFVRIKNEKTRDVLGSGLGLSILKRIVDLYEGTIDVRSQPDKGTTFAITLKTPVAGTENP